MFFKKIDDNNNRKITCAVCHKHLDTCKILRDDTTKEFIRFMRGKELIIREHDDYFVCLLCINCIDRIERNSKKKKDRKT